MKLKKFSCKAAAVVAALAMVLTTMPLSTYRVHAAASGFTVGDTSGTADIMNVAVGGNATDHGYKIKDAKGLIYFAECVNSGVSFAGKTITLAGDIDLNPGVQLLDANHELASGVDLSKLYQFPGIGTSEHAFDGSFNGNGYVIKGLYMTSETSAHDTCTALFNVVDNSTLKNIGIVDSYIRITEGYGAGLLADTGYSVKKPGAADTAKVTNCFFVGQVDASGNDAQWIGGLVGFFGSDKNCPAELTDCYADAIVTSDAAERVGMMVGQNYGNVGSCYVTGGSVTANVNTIEHVGPVWGRQGTIIANQPSYTVKGIVNAAQSFVTAANTTSSECKVLATAEEVKAVVPNKCFLAVVNGTYVFGKGIPSTDASGTVTYSNSYEGIQTGAGVSSVPDGKKEVLRPVGAPDGGYDYSWTITEDGIQGLPEICTDGSRTNVTEELLAALETAINTEGFFKPAKNVILMIGDGMGINPVTASEHWYGELIMNELPNQGASMTKSYTSEFATRFSGVFTEDVTITDSLTITDSSAGGSAIASGYKTYYYSIATGVDGSQLKSLADVKKEQNGAIGIISNGWISDATPAVFITHSIKRGLDDEDSNRIAYKQLYLQRQMFDYVPDLLIGQASQGERIDTEMTSPLRVRVVHDNKMGIAYDWEEYLNLQTENNIYISPATFDYELDQSSYPTVPNMVQVTAQALQNLEKQGGEEGFFVMIEDGETDMYGHDNQYENQLQEVQNLDEAVAVAIKFVLEHPDTLLLVTADHDTGGLRLNDGWDSDFDKAKYTTGGHSENNVPVYAIGYGTEIINGQVFQNNYTGRILGNLMGDIGFGDSEKDPMVILDGGEYAGYTIGALIDTDKEIGKSSNKLETCNVLSKEEKDGAIAKVTNILFVPPTQTTTDAKIVKAGATMAALAAPVATREDVAFTGWYKDEARTILWDFDKDVVPESGDLVLYAGWEIVPVTEEAPETEAPAVDVNGTETTPSNNNVILIVVVAAVALLVVAGVVVILAKKKKKAK